MTDGRLNSLDQFRGYTVAGMLLVNFIGGFDVVPAVLKHHNTYCSYADTIMPQFFYAVGFAFRLTYLRRKQREGIRDAVSHAVWRDLGLIVLGVFWYHLGGKVQTWEQLRQLGVWGVLIRDFGRSPFETLTLIGMTSLWVLPVIGATVRLRVAYMIASAVLYVMLSYLFYFDWAWNRPAIDGGPLSFLTWAIPLLVGSLAFDAMSAPSNRMFVRLSAYALALMALGIGLSRIGGEFSWPFLTPSSSVNLWTMSQRTGSVTYLTFCAGFSLAVNLLFVLLCDIGPLKSGLLDLLGRNALAAYLVPSIVSETIKPYTPKDAPAWYVTGAFLLYFAISCVFIRHLEKRGTRL